MSSRPVWKFFVDKNRSTAIASILRFVSEFLQSISLAIEFLQSILVRHRVFAIEFLQSILVRRRVFAINRVFARVPMKPGTEPGTESEYVLIKAHKAVSWPAWSRTRN